MAAPASIAAASTASVSTTGRNELAQFHQRQRVASSSSLAGGRKPQEPLGRAPGASSAAYDNNSNGNDSGGVIGLGVAVLAAAQELAQLCQIPGVSEAATAVCMVANLVANSRDSARASETRLRQCSTIVMALKRAAKMAEKVSWKRVVCFIFRA